MDAACLTAQHPSLATLLAADSASAFVVAQLGQSLDGRIATLGGQSRYINGPAALDHLHALRAHVDAVIVGVGTILADDPLLTVRRCAGRSPVRVIIDPRGRMPAGARCLRDDGIITLVVRPQAGPNSLALPVDAGGHIAPRAIVAALVARGLRRILVEGGASTLSAFIDAGCIDRLHLLVAPMIIGSGMPGLTLAPVKSLGQALRPQTIVYPLPGGDVLFDCDLRSPRAAPTAE